MRCTSCSYKVKPIVAVDIDGTLGDYHGHFVRFAESYLNESLRDPVYTGRTSMREWFTEQFGCDSATWSQVKLAYRQGGMKRSMPLIDGAKDLVFALNAMSVQARSVEVWVTTTRPYLRLDGIDPDTRFWLQEHAGLLYTGLLYDEDKYERLAERVDSGRVVAVLDDLPEQYRAAHDLFGPDVPILAAGYQNLNVATSNMYTRLSVRAAVSAIQGRIWEWNDKHDDN